MRGKSRWTSRKICKKKKSLFSRRTQRRVRTLKRRVRIIIILYTREHIRYRHVCVCVYNTCTILPAAVPRTCIILVCMPDAHTRARARSKIYTHTQTHYSHKHTRARARTLRRNGIIAGSPIKYNIFKVEWAPPHTVVVRHRRHRWIARGARGGGAHDGAESARRMR